MPNVVSCLQVYLHLRLGGMSRSTVRVVPPVLQEQGHPLSVIPAEYTCSSIREGM